MTATAPPAASKSQGACFFAGGFWVTAGFVAATGAAATGVPSGASASAALTRGLETSSGGIDVGCIPGVATVTGFASSFSIALVTAVLFGGKSKVGAVDRES